MIENISKKISKDIIKFCKEVKVSNIVICPFAHLSNDLADYKKGIEFFDLLEKELKKTKLKIIRSHFGSDKSLLLDVVGHKGNVRFREY